MRFYYFVILLFVFTGELFAQEKEVIMEKTGNNSSAWEKDTLPLSSDEKERYKMCIRDSYRIGMGGGAVSSVDTGVYAGAIELNAVQRSNPEMQKRVNNAIRAMAESEVNPIISIHDHGAGGHLNCLSELVEETGGKIHMEKLPVGDPTLSAKEDVYKRQVCSVYGISSRKTDFSCLQYLSFRAG